MEIDHPPQEGGESVQKHASSVWETRPTLIPITVTLRDGLPKREVQVRIPLDTTIDWNNRVASRLVECVLPIHTTKPLHCVPCHESSPML